MMIYLGEASTIVSHAGEIQGRKELQEVLTVYITWPLVNILCYIPSSLE